MIGSLVSAGLLMVCSQSGAHAATRSHGRVKVDNRTGHLVRTVVVPTRPVVSPAPLPAVLPTAPDPKLNEIVEAAAREHNVDPLLVHSVIQVESNYKPAAVSPKGAQGLMQLIPATARRFGVVNSFDPKENIFAGVKYLKYLNTLFPDDLRLALAAYNAGEGAVMKYGNAVPPYRETEQYVESVGKRYDSALRAADLKKKTEQNTAAPNVPEQEKHPPIEAFFDEEGRLNIRTKALEMVSTP